MVAYLHIGNVKTGTTTIQNFCALNENKLLEKGCIYPQSFRITSRHWGLVEQILSPNKDRNEQVLKGLNGKEFKAHCNKKFIFSCEGIVWEFSKIEYIQQLKIFLENLGFDKIYIILYLRNISDLLNSLYSQEIKNNLQIDLAPIDPNVHSKKHIFDYKWLCQSYASVFGIENLKIRIFEKDEFFNQDLIEDFLHCIDLEVNKNEFLIPQNQNKSLNLLGIELLKRINQKSKDPNTIKFLSKIIEKYFELDSFHSHLKFSLKAQLCENYEKFFSNSNEWVRWNFFPHKKELFRNQNIVEANDRVGFKDTDYDDIVDFVLEIVRLKNNTIKFLKEF
ncbi:hypothetical protein [Campylobacter lari]|uniref:hypothetical protein n=1 Tax=Campylobacter lari TaxID=201 RepID=UPI00144DD95F|nr:hypothetical protein [Campylobacter lari]MBT0759288.1 hypothetical protein [Campylobacter lari]